MPHDSTWRFFKFPWQRLTRGFDDSATWNFDETCSRWVAPRLRRFRELTIRCPSELKSEEWLSILDDMVYFHEVKGGLYFDQRQANESPIEIDEARFGRGQEAWAKYYRDLWW